MQRPPLVRSLRTERTIALVVAGLLAGALFGVGAVDDIRDSLRAGRIGAVSYSALPPPAPDAQAPVRSGFAPTAAVDEELGEAHGFTTAARLGFTDASQCADLDREFRDGCEAYVETRGSRGS